MPRRRGGGERGVRVIASDGRMGRTTDWEKNCWGRAGQGRSIHCIAWREDRICIERLAWGSSNPGI